MKETTIAALTSVIASRFGLQPGPTWEETLRNGVAQAGRRLGCSKDAAARSAMEDPTMLRALAGHLTVDETYFLRHREHFLTIASHLGRNLAGAACKAELTVWSAGCSTGEEPYSAAMVICEQLGRHTARQVTIVASDLSRDAISEALEGTYGRWSFRNVPQSFVSRNFAAKRCGRHQVRDEHRRMVTFSHRAVQEHLPLLRSASIDVVLFRNVAIYLDAVTLEHIWEGFARVLKGDGLLIVSPTDPRPPRHLFHGTEAGGTCVFRPAQHRQEGPVPTATACTGPRRVGRPSPSQLPNRSAAPTIADARRLGDQGRLAEALEAASRIAAAAPGDKNPHLLRGVIALSASRFQEAVEDLRRALFIDRQDMLTRYWYAQALQLAGRAPLALSQVRAVERWLKTVPEATVLEDGRTRADELLGAVRLLKESLE